MNPKKAENLAFFQRELQKFLTDPILKGKFIVIHDKQIKSSADTFDSALSWAVANLPPEEFLIQQIMNPNEQVNFLRCAI